MGIWVKEKNKKRIEEKKKREKYQALRLGLDFHPYSPHTAS